MEKNPDININIPNEVLKLLDNIPAYITINDKNHKIVWVNKFLNEHPAIKSSVFLGKSLHEVFPDNANKFIEENLKVFESGIPLNFETTKIVISNIEIWSKTTKIPYFNPNTKKPEYIIVLTFDMSDHVTDIMGRIDTEVKYRVLFDNAPFALLLMDLNGNIIDCNENFCSLLEINYEDIIGRNIEKFKKIITDDESEQVFVKTIKDMLISDFNTFGRSYESVELELKLNSKQKDGSNKQKLNIIELIPFVISYPEEQSKILIIIRDLTEKKNLEKELLKAQKLESIAVLAGGIAHDFNNILTAVLGNISLAEISLDDPNEVLTCLSDAKRSVMRAKSLTEQLLLFSKGGYLKSNTSTTNSLPILLKELAELMLKGSNIKCHFNFEKNLPVVKIDEGQINQVFQNIIINAMQAMPSGGNIYFSLKQVHISQKIKYSRDKTLKEGDYLLIQIKDEGQGIAPEIIDKIFDPFFTTKAGGSGLGLAISYSIIKNHKGYITVASELNKGTTFNIYLPALKDHDCNKVNVDTDSLMLVSAEKNKAPSTEIESPNTTNELPFDARKNDDKKIFYHTDKDPGLDEAVKKRNILILDDNYELLISLRKLLQNFGFQVNVTENCSEAINLYKKALELGEPFDVVILDLIIPGEIGGIQTYHELKKIDPNARAILISGYSHVPDGDLSKFVKEEKGIIEFLKKPFGMDDLLQLLRNVPMRKP